MVSYCVVLCTQIKREQDVLALSDRFQKHVLDNTIQQQRLAEMVIELKTSSEQMEVRNKEIGEMLLKITSGAPIPVIWPLQKFKRLF